MLAWLGWRSVRPTAPTTKGVKAFTARYSIVYSRQDEGVKRWFLWVPTWLPVTEGHSGVSGALLVGDDSRRCSQPHTVTTLRH